MRGYLIHHEIKNLKNQVNHIDQECLVIIFQIKCV